MKNSLFEKIIVTQLLRNTLLNIIIQSMLLCSKSRLSFRFPHPNLHGLLFSPICATCPPHPILLDLIVQIIFDKGCKLRSSSLHSHLDPPVNSFLPGPHTSNITVKKFPSFQLNPFNYVTTPQLITDQQFAMLVPYFLFKCTFIQLLLLLLFYWLLQRTCRF